MTKKKSFQGFKFLMVQGFLELLIPRFLGALILMLIFVLSFTISSKAATSLDPSLKWKTLETLHFKVNYYDKIEDQAYKVASIAEEVHSRLSPLFRHTPDLKTEIVLLDNTDYTNGYTTVFPNPLITLYLTNMNSNYQPFSYDDWLRYVFIHEYTHLLHLDTVEGGAQLFKLLLGRSIFPNWLNPLFIVEGLAVFEESKYSAGGRLNDPRWQAWLRMEALSDNMKSIQQASVTTVAWPIGNTAYLYGSSFVKYLADKYGEDKLYRLSQEYGDYILSYGPDMAFSNIFGKSLWVLWKDWQDEVIKKAKTDKEAIEKKPLTKSRMLTDKGYYNFKPVWDYDSSKVYYTQINMDDSAQIKSLDVNNLNGQKIMEGYFFDDSMSKYKDNLYFSKSDIYKNFYFYNDLYCLNLKNKSLKRLTEGARASDPAVSPDGQKIVFVKNDAGTKTLWIMNSNGSNQRKFTASGKEEEYLSPVFSPDGKTVAVSKWVKGRQKIVIVSVNTGIEKFMTNENFSTEANPYFTPDGKYILFESDITGIPNLYAFNLKSSDIYRITNVLGMAIMPAVSPDGTKIAYVNYTQKGYDLAIISFNPSSWEKTSHKAKTNGLAYKSAYDGSLDEKEEVVLKKYDYNPIPSLIPKFWFPYSYGDENGEHLLAYTAGVDALSQQFMQLQAGYDWTAKRPTYSLMYNNDQFLPQLALVADDVALAYSWDADTKTYWEREQDFGAYLSLYGNRVFSEFDRQAFSVGYEHVTLNNISSLEILVNQPTLGKLSGYYAAYNYNSLKSFGLSVAPEEGFAIGAFARLYSKDAASDYNLTNYTVRGSTYYKTFIPHHALSLSAVGSLSYGDSFVQSGFSYKNVSVRGYPYNYVSGSKSAKGSIQYIFPLGYPEIGYGYGYLFLDRLYGKFFFDQVGATFGAASSIDWKRTIGVEIGLSTINGWGMFPVGITMGYAKGIDAGGEDEGYFGFSL
ncbi:hypothetical protein A3J90_05280 [candidate division WOR-1 bacterium RIFOXYC2_FULL_37_10]|uniref:Uncharacterized protein n=1 Tax=candidate division WOR-1 bacterium RIFOXYB2_FULL_37_13 TaxID=1802579 RepID=A0A1F4SUR7_UNCSA|nr:MAG: hypothetical protein A2310_06505 [candidate division WOR-1 bacterium RIFOXYB2_FULL_37_13]OGC32385.1 MAG: hypothetical protein A3J90_05280 [candidate division WOR-1 bacterium RIFOXYC2_FULL_37_10]